MKWLSVVLSAWLLGASVPASLAAEELKAKRPDGEPPSKALAEENPEAKKEGRKTNSGPGRAEWEKHREQLEKMTPEERDAKRKEIKERLEKRIVDLRAKQTNATITVQEKRELERREQILKRFEQTSSAGKEDGTEPKKPAVLTTQEKP